MIFRTKRGAGGYQDGLPGGFSRPGQAGADDIQDKTRRPLSGQGAVRYARTRRGAYSGRLTGGFSLPGQSRGAGADDIQDKTRRPLSGQGAVRYARTKPRRLFRTAYWGIQLARTKPRRRPLSGQGADDMPGQSAAPIQDGLLGGGFSLPGQAGADDIQDKTRRRRLSGRLTGGIQLARTRRRSSICQDKARRLFRTAYWGIQLARTKRGAGRFQAQAQMIFQDKTRRRRLSGRLTGGDSACQDKARRRPLSGAGADDIQDKTRRRRLSGRLTGGIQLARTSRRR